LLICHFPSLILRFSVYSVTEKKRSKSATNKKRKQQTADESSEEEEEEEALNLVNFRSRQRLLKLLRSMGLESLTPPQISVKSTNLMDKHSGAGLEASGMC
jgi:hypothetical protein